MAGIPQGLLRFLIFWLYLPAHRQSRSLREASRRLRTALGLRPSRPGSSAGLEIPSKPWYRICRASGTVFREMRKAHGNVTLAELAVLNALCRTFRPRTIFEIGTFDGRTTLNLAMNSEARIWTLDLPEGLSTVYPIGDRNEKFTRKPSAGSRFCSPPNDTHPCVQRITQLYGDSASFDFSPWHQAIDMVFIDGSHAYEYVVSDSRTALQLLRPEGGIIVWHDYGAEWADVSRALHELQATDPALRLIHVRGTSLVISSSLPCSYCSLA